MLKKRQRFFVLIMLSFLMFVNIYAGPPMATANSCLPRIGDVNGDNAIDDIDARLITEFCSGNKPEVFIKEVADVNRDGLITNTDADLITQYYTGQIATFPVVNVDVLLSQMTLAEKIGQMIQVEQTAIFDDEFRTLTEDPQMTWIPVTNISPDDVGTYAIGSILTGGDSFPYTGKNFQSATPEQWADMYDTLQRKALSSRLMIPIIWGADTVHGFGNLQGATIFPHNIGLGATRDADLVKRIGQITAKESIACGVDWTFSPCLEVPQDDRWGRAYEGFSEDPSVVAQLGVAYVNGIQGTDLADENSILATAKHYIGSGGTTWGSGIMSRKDADGQVIGGCLLDRGNLDCSEDKLREMFLPPFAAVIKEPSVPVGAVMVAFNSWNMVKCHANKYLITDVLKGELGFKGFVISDWEGFAQINAPCYAPPLSYDETINDLQPWELRDCINAGVDMLMVDSIWSSPWRFKEVIQMIQDLVNDGSIPISRIDDAVRRILTVKKNMGVFEKPFANRANQSLIGCEAHRAVAREAVRKSLVILKNKNNILPLRKGIGKIHVVGPKADDLGSQCGGWTLTWQGAGEYLKGGTTILQGIQNAVGTQSTVTYSANGTEPIPDGTNVIIVVVGEKPYAEYEGDRGDAVLPYGLSNEEIELIDKVHTSAPSIPIIGILISGSPIPITDQIDKFDALIAAWLPGSEGQGVADVLYGDYKPTGKLPYTWPRSVDQIPINDATGSQNPLFPFGFGLSW